MTPGARVAAAIEILDRVLGGQASEAALTRWARASRFAGSKDRAAVRDHVFDALRRRRSAAWVGGGETGRGLMLGSLRLSGVDPAVLMNGEGHAPPSPTRDDVGAPLDQAPDAVRYDLPDWLWQLFCDSLGAAPAPAAAAAEALRHRAPVGLRVNTARTTRAAAQDRLRAEGVETTAHPRVATALLAGQGARRIQRGGAWSDGWVELQDVASQAAVARLPLRDGMSVLDFCAGGGGKTLAMGAAARVSLVAHDAAPRRMTDLPVRAARAGLQVHLAATEALADLGPFDLVLVDAPCSGSGTWRRAPEAKWRLTPDELARLTDLQARILTEAAPRVAPGGWLAYATCSILADENAGIVDRFCQVTTGWRLHDRMDLTVDAGHDGFHLSVLRRG